MGQYNSKDERLREQTTAYFTILSIIQGVAFGKLILSTIDIVKSNGLEVLYPPQNVSLIFIVTFVTICITWNEYARIATRLNWQLDLRDTFIPFILATGELICCASINSSALWCFGYTAWTFLGFLAYLNVISKFKDNQELEIREAICNYALCSRCVLFCAVIGAVGLRLFLWYPESFEVAVAMV